MHFAKSSDFPALCFSSNRQATPAGKEFSIRFKKIISILLKYVGWGFHPDGFFDEDENFSFINQILRKPKPFGLFRGRKISVFF